MAQGIIPPRDFQVAVDDQDFYVLGPCSGTLHTTCRSHLSTPPRISLHIAVVLTDLKLSCVWTSWLLSSGLPASWSSLPECGHFCMQFRATGMSPALGGNLHRQTTPKEVWLFFCWRCYPSPQTSQIFFIFYTLDIGANRLLSNIPITTIIRNVFK